MNERIISSLKEHGLNIIGLIGEGSYATMYQVKWDSYPEHTFAAKIISIEGGRKQWNTLTSENEINTLSHLFHKNIIKVYKHFNIDDKIVILMEYCSRSTLSDFVKAGGTLISNQFKRIAQECLEAVAFCHKKSIAHRDIKPSNIAFNENYIVKLFDFGLSDIVEQEMINRYEGSICYKSPEMFNKEPHNPMKADIWALRITFYYCLYGSIPWKSNTFDKLILEISFKNIQFPENEDPSIKKLIRTMTMKDPNDRWSAEELLQLPLFKKGRLKSIYSSFSQYSPVYKSLALSRRYTCRVSQRIVQKSFIEC